LKKTKTLTGFFIVNFLFFLIAFYTRVLKEFYEHSQFLSLVEKQTELQTEVGILKLTLEKLQPQVDVVQKEINSVQQQLEEVNRKKVFGVSLSEMTKRNYQLAENGIPKAIDNAIDALLNSEAGIDCFLVLDVF
jgi:peptidoglycan hydrolase CwlO-like protein